MDLHRRSLANLARFTILVSAAACGGGGGSSTDTVGGLVVFGSRSADFASSAAREVAVGDDRFAYLADEGATGAGDDLNGDGDATDLVAVLFDVDQRQATELRAAVDVRVVDDAVFLVTDEALDGLDWDLDGQADDLVLLHHAAATGTTFVATLLREELLVVGERLYFSVPSTPASGPMETTLHWVTSSAPTTPQVVLGDPSAVGVDLQLLEADEGLVFLTADETASSTDFNADGDDDDQHVLVLLDGTDSAAVALSTGRALAGASTPLRAVDTGTNDWLVAFLVGEAEQGNTNLNHPAVLPPGWQPASCNGLEDADTLDTVLHYVRFADWSADPITSPPVNTGLVGTQRVLALHDSTSGRSFVGTVSREADEGACSLNGDGDQNDRILRWVEVLGSGGFEVPGDEDDYLAIAEVPGGARGVVEVEGRFVAVVSEADDDRDHDGDTADDHDILGWLDPFDLANASWRFPQHQNGTALGVDWMAENVTEDGEDEGFVFTDLEEVFDAACNTGDSDQEDAFAIFGRFNPSDAEDLQWNGYCYAVDPFNAGMVVVDGVAFLRANEEEQGRDMNEDGDMDDAVLLCHTVFPLGRLFYVGPLNDLVGPSVFRGDDDTVCYLADERMAGRDLNDDGDANDYVVRYVDID